jgi:predicted dehydrogenase
MHKTLTWGILGTGRIARRFAVELPHAQWGKLVAAGSRTQAAADAFVAEFQIPRAYGSYDDLLADPKVDAIYISLPNHLHAHWAIRCAEAGKHILCEKPLTTNHPEAMTVVETARANDVFLMEAFMYRCHPQIAQLQEAIRTGAIGEVRLIQAYFSYNMGGHNDDIRLQNDFAGGGIMDVGCYPISIVRLIAGAARGQPFANPIVESDGYRSEMAVKAYGHIGGESQVDEWATATLKFPGDILAEVACGLQLRTNNEVTVWGSQGHIVLQPLAARHRPLPGRRRRRHRGLPGRPARARGDGGAQRETAVRHRG